MYKGMHVVSLKEHKMAHLPLTQEMNLEEGHLWNEKHYQVSSPSNTLWLSTNQNLKFLQYFKCQVHFK